jgi:hypothetical protein
MSDNATNYYEVTDMFGEKQIVSLYVKGELFNADNTPATYIGKGTTALREYQRNNKPKSSSKKRKSNDNENTSTRGS